MSNIISLVLLTKLVLFTEVVIAVAAFYAAWRCWRDVQEGHLATTAGLFLLAAYSTGGLCFSVLAVCNLLRLAGLGPASHTASVLGRAIGIAGIVILVVALPLSFLTRRRRHGE